MNSIKKNNRLYKEEKGKHMIEQGKGGVIVQTSSMYGLIAPDQRIYEGSQYMGCQMNSPASYTVSKAAVIGLTKYLAAYWGQKGVRVNSISPGGVINKENNLQNKNFIKNYSKRVPIKRMAKSSEIANAVLFLCSDLSSYMNGSNLVVDGGWTAI